MDNWFKHIIKKSMKVVCICTCIFACIFSFCLIRKKEVTIDYLGHRYTVSTLSNTVRSLIKDKKIYIDDTYSITPNLDSILSKNEVVSITKNEQLAKIDINNERYTDIEYVKIEEEKEVINFTTEEKENDKIIKGNKKVIQKGENGERVVVYRTVYKGDKQVKKETMYEHRREPVAEKIEVGTKENTPTIYRGSAINANSSDVEVLASLIQAEAGGEIYLGQVAVGAVCVNRLKTGRYGNSIRDVVFAPNQFCAVRLGILKPVSPGSSAYRAAQEAFSGVDPTNGALYFYNPSATSSWSKSRPVKAVIGNHTFTI